MSIPVAINRKSNGGEEEIRTPETLSDLRAFQARALDQLCDLSMAIN